MGEDWGDGCGRFWNGPFDTMPLLVEKIVANKGRRLLLVPRLPSQPWFARLCAFSSRTVALGHERETYG